MKRETGVLKELKQTLIANFGDDIDQIILFGSRVKKSSSKDSDYDVLIILNRDYNWEYEDNILSVIYEFELKHEVFIDLKLISSYELNHTFKGAHPLYIDALQEGIHL